MHHEVATMGKIGNLTPTMIQHVAPGDTWSGKVGLLVRLSPLNRALLHDIYVDQFSFYVPYRLLWADWENFIAAGPEDTPTYVPPTKSVTANSVQNLPIFLNPHVTETVVYAAWTSHAYNLIWNEYFRDEQDAIQTPSAHVGEWGRFISFKRDYWTTLREATGFAQSEHFADVTAGTPDKVSALEILRAIQQQKIATKRATYGTRYIDILRSYGINVNYQMLQRPELVAMSRGSINVTDVVSTSNATGTEGDLGSLAGHGISGTRLKLRRKTFPEHGVLMNFVVLRPVACDVGYADYFDTPRNYSEFYDPALVSMPPQEIFRNDVMPTSDAIGATDRMGFQQWGDWYRAGMSRVHKNLAGWTGSTALDPSSFNPIELRNILDSEFDQLFQDITYGHYQVSAVNALKALRAIPKTNAVAGANRVGNIATI